MTPWVQLVWSQAVARLPRPVVPLLIPATSEHPRGWKGDAIRRSWMRYRDGAPGTVFVDGDMAPEPPAFGAMERAIRSDPEAIWTAACRIWMPSHSGMDLSVSGESPDQQEQIRELVRMNPDAYWTSDTAYRCDPRPRGVLAHRVFGPDGKARWGDPSDDMIDLFGLGCTYLPNRLCERVEAMGLWGEIDFPSDDRTLSLIALQEPRIPARLAPGCVVPHLHWDEAALREFIEKEADRDGSQCEPSGRR